MSFSVASANSPAACAATSQTGSRSKFGERRRCEITTGKLRPSDCNTSQGSIYDRRISVSSVADITMIFRSGRLEAWICSALARLMSPNRCRS